MLHDEVANGSQLCLITEELINPTIRDGFASFPGDIIEEHACPHFSQVYIDQRPRKANPPGTWPQIRTPPPIFTYAKFDVQALCRRETALRDEIECACDVNQHPASGSFNWAIRISFEDGTRWFLREAATLQYIKASSDIPIPDVYDYSATSDNDIGIPYILMSEASGQPLSNTWKPVPLHVKAKVLFQLGANTWKLSRLRFDQIGSLFKEQGSFEAKECLSRGHVMQDRCSLEGIPRGPFTPKAEFYSSLITAFTEHAEALPLSHHCFVVPVPQRDDYESDSQYHRACDLWNDFVAVGSKLDSSDNRLDCIIAGDSLRDIIQRLDPETTLESFPLYQPDLSVNNIYTMLLIPPGLPHSHDELSQDLIAAFRNGFSAAISSTLRTETAEYSKSFGSPQQSRCFWLLTRLLNFDSEDDFNLFTPRSSPYYKQRYEEMRLEDEPLEKTQRKEHDYFRHQGILRHSIARKLTLVSRDNRRDGMFIADSRLWKWILECMDEWERIS
ncbi:uncharacterized protein ASPGLDRAFT_63040 [Aspergillus glaucus CBS 516.65]|uniref:Uncharacterized protein n=1 Tax=Aspergillus glaucus CBS 516.65 TaxID=1160497 RepID=A0A1L9W0A0_ASPGL|nr:hypothetical protein ASPGLDRAFT_63040 [Aspergillus glaucus CBS 516.65]OJJ89569.1 hypothetical protein ASPGLDRAFT_63040 [Aspergillus glaucus CBS 516.65]